MADRGAALGALRAPTVQVLRRVDILNADGTPWLTDVAVVDGGITVGDGAGARRTCTFTLHAPHRALAPHVGGVWFDKILRAYRGLLVPGDPAPDYLVPVFTGRIEPIDDQDFTADTITVSGSDSWADLAAQKYPTVQTFSEGQAVEQVIRAIAAHGGVTKFRLQATGRALDREWQIETDPYLADSILQVCVDYGLEAFFAPDDHLVVKIDVPADQRPTAHTFTPGVDLGRLAKRSSGLRLYNHVIVRGENPDPDTEVVWAEAENREPSSPTRIRDDAGGIPRRTYTHSSPLIGDVETAQASANTHLARRAILDREARITGQVVPWLDAGDVVEVVDPAPGPDDPPVGRWQLSQFPIPWQLGSVEYQGRWAQRVGAAA